MEIKKEKFKILLVVIIILYLALLLKLIVFKYPPGVTFSTANANLIPSKTILGYLSGEPTWRIAMRNLLGNIVILIPFGFLIAIPYQRIKWGKILLVGFFTGLILELLQVIFKSGILDIDDVILNSLGVVIGYLFMKYFKNITKNISRLLIVNMNKDVIVKKSNIQGKGIFANRDFKKGEVVLRWNPKEITKSQLEELPEIEKHYIFKENGKILLMQEPERYVNHSCDSNTKPVNDCDVAIREIKKGEEVTSDYYSVDSLDRFECKCGSKNCRGSVEN